MLDSLLSPPASPLSFLSTNPAPVLMMTLFPAVPLQQRLLACLALRAPVPRMLRSLTAGRVSCSCLPLAGCSINIGMQEQLIYTFEPVFLVCAVGPFPGGEQVFWEYRSLICGALSVELIQQGWWLGRPRGPLVSRTSQGHSYPDKGTEAPHSAGPVKSCCSVEGHGSVTGQCLGISWS